MNTFRNLLLSYEVSHRDKCVPVTTGWCVIRLRRDERPPVWRVAANRIRSRGQSTMRDDSKRQFLWGITAGFFYHFPKHHMKIILHFNAKVGRANIFKPTIGNESLHQDRNYNAVRIVNFATSKNLVLKSTMFPHRDIHKYSWTSPDEKTHNQIDHILIDRRQHSSIRDVRSFRGADCDTDRYLVVAKWGKHWQ